MKYERALLEDWMRDFYYDADFDLGSSGVECITFGDLRKTANISLNELDQIVLKDSDSFGGESLREVIAKRWGDNNPEHVMVTHGSSEATYLILNSLLDAGDEVVVLNPSYHPLVSIPEKIGCDISFWNMDSDSGFSVGIEELRELMTDKTKMLVLNFPHNPTGVTITLKQYHEILSIVSEVDAYLFWDGAFADIVYDTDPLPNPLIYYKKSISTGTFSKSFGMPGLRFGWCTASREVLEKLVPLRDRLTLHLSPLTEFLAEKAILCIDEILKNKRLQAKENLKVLEAWINLHSETITWAKPAGGVAVFIKFKGITDTESLCKDLGERWKTLLVPGKCFGYPEYVRLGFGDNQAKLIGGLKVLEEYIQKIYLTEEEDHTHNSIHE
ncbi:capreomycidine synthase [Fontibacillus solani]|uniref:Capreomycidine synthase n=1 Tax=Fontibacillus solani TaxID=1572857 RepID=A0A7W3SRI0_9BACL|nr:capreomycidine synthase [Fontibacillus solani]MBA9084927.1 capreomycidine synthase [Fontibacillus solani]